MWSKNFEKNRGGTLASKGPPRGTLTFGRGATYAPHNPHFPRGQDLCGAEIFKNIRRVGPCVLLWAISEVLLVPERSLAHAPGP